MQDLILLTREEILHVVHGDHWRFVFQGDLSIFKRHLNPIQCTTKVRKCPDYGVLDLQV